MRFEHVFEITASPEELIEKFDDVPLIAGFLPGASVGPVNNDGSYPGALTVSFGPKRISFQGSLRNEVDRPALRGVMSGTANADVRGARMAVKLNYELSEVEGSQPVATQVSLVSEAQLTGVLAQFAKTGGTVLVHAVLDEFAQRFSAHCAGEGARPAESSGRESATDTAGTLPVGLVISGIFKQWMRRLGALLRRAR